MKYCFDLDGTLCTNTYGKYENAVPFNERIDIVNRLHDEGNKIIIESARGSSTGIDWKPFTEEQLKKWGVKYDFVRTGIKIEADIYIDDRGIKDINFFNGENK